MTSQILVKNSKKKITIVVESLNLTKTMQNVKQIQKIFNMSTFFINRRARESAHEQKHDFRPAMCEGLRRAGASERIKNFNSK